MKQKLDLSIAKYHDIIDEKYDYAILPWGATEPHNYHLPYATDCNLAYHIALDSALKAYEIADIKGMVLPYIPFGSQNPGQFNLPFCLHASYTTQQAILADVVSSLVRQGIDKLFIVNGHGGNNFKNMIRDLAVKYPQFLIVSVDWFKVEPQDGYFENKDDHAGEQETSVLMHYMPNTIDLTIAGSGESKTFKSKSLQDGVGWTPRNWAKVSTDTGVGNPSKSTAEKGKRYAEVVVNKIANLFVEIIKDDIYY